MQTTPAQGSGGSVVEVVVVGASVVVVVVVAGASVVVDVVVFASVVFAETQLLPWQTPLAPPLVVQATPGVAEVTQAPDEQVTV